jgi:hypothetical protein
VVIGGEQGDQAENKATQGLGEAEPVETEANAAGAGEVRLETHRWIRFWRC